MTIGSLFVQNYRAFGWLIIAASAIGGAITIGPLLFFLMRKPITRWLCRALTDKVRHIRAERDKLSRTVKELEEDNATMRSNWGQAVIKATQGVAVVLSAFGLNDKGGHNG